MRQRGALFCLTGWHEYLIFLLPYGRDFRLTCKGMKPYFFLPCRCVFLPPRREQHILLFLPYGSDVSPSGEVETPAWRAVSPHLLAGEILLIFRPCGHGVSSSGGVGTPARRAARWGRLWGYAPFILMPNPVLQALGRHRRRCRRAVWPKSVAYGAAKPRPTPDFRSC